MQILFGYAGKSIRVDLTNAVIKTEVFSEETLRKYIGGSGLAAKIVFDETDQNTDPLGPENVLAIMTGPFAGTGVPNCGRHHAAAKSPLTGLLGEGNSGGTWGQKLKYAGWDGVILNGASDKPMYLLVQDDKVELLPADEYWGMDTFEFDDRMKELYGKQAVTLSIGPAGENLVKIAAIMNDGYDGRAVGRCGLGAVMGSKKLKGIVVIGTGRPEVADKEALKESIKNTAKGIREATKGALGGYGTSVGVMAVEQMGDLPIKNWTLGNMKVEKITGQAMAATILKKQYFCAQCAIGCGRTVQVTEGPYASNIVTGGPEYETIALLGANLLIDDLTAIQRSNEICNRMGMDTISAGGVVAFAYEAFEKGLITEKELGCKARWGNADDSHEILRKIAFREDFGDVLAEGTKAAAEKLGGIAKDMAVHVKGLEFPAHDPRAVSSVGLAYATSTRGADHLNAFTGDMHGPGYSTGFGFMEASPYNRFELGEKDIRLTVVMQNAMAQCDSMSCCKFLLFGLGPYFFPMIQTWFKQVVGWDITVEEWLETGERIFNLKRLYQNKHGISRKDDMLPPRMTQRRGTGGAADYIPPVAQALDKYYEMRGWDIYGIPTDETLKRLGLEYAREGAAS